MFGSKQSSLDKALLLGLCVLLAGCGARNKNGAPSIEFTRIPPAGEGGPDKLASIEGRVTGARPGQQIVLFAKSGPWWVQPLADQPFTRLPDSPSVILHPDRYWNPQERPKPRVDLSTAVKRTIAPTGRPSSHPARVAGMSECLFWAWITSARSCRS